MAGKKITELVAATTPADADLIEIVQDVATTPVSKKVTWTTLKTFLGAVFAVLASPTFTGVVTTPAIKITTGAGATKVLTSAADGNASWATPTGRSAEDVLDILANQIFS